MQGEIITGLDVGSTAIRIVVGHKPSSIGETEEKIRIIGVAEAPSQGLSKGVVTSIEDATSSISHCLEKAERITGVPIERVWVGISGAHIISQESKGVIAVSRASGEIKEDDVERAIEAARTVATPPNYKILHVIPRGFIVDEQGGIKDPVGMTGVRLEVDAQIIQGLSSQIKNLTKCVYRTGLEIEDLVLSILATSEAILTPRQKELGVALANIGGAITNLIVFEEGDILQSAVLPIGSEHITSDIAIGLRVSIDLAEKIKLEYGSAISKDIGKKDEIDLKELGNNSEEGTVSRKYVAEIIEARVEEIFEKIDSELKKINRSGLLPAGMVLTGGGANLPGIIDIAKKKLRLPSCLGCPVEIIKAIDKINDPAFSTALGLVIWGGQSQLQRKGRFEKVFSHLKGFDKASGRIKKWFKSLIP